MVLSDKQSNIMKQRTTTTTATPLTTTTTSENVSKGASETMKRSNMSSTTYSSRDKDRSSKPSKTVNFRPSSLINERINDSNQNDVPPTPTKVRANYSYDSQANRKPAAFKPNSQNSYYAQAIGNKFLIFTHLNFDL